MALPLVGTFDGFYALLAEDRGAALVVAVDNEQYVAWVRARWGIELQGGEGFATIADLLGSRVQYRRGDALALALDGPAERFDVVLCFGILHRVENPLGLLRRLAALLAPGVACWSRPTDRGRRPRRRAHDRGPAAGRRPRRRRVRLLGFGAGGLAAIAQLVGLGETRVDGTVVVDGHPRIMATLTRAKTLVD